MMVGTHHTAVRAEAAFAPTEKKLVASAESGLTLNWMSGNLSLPAGFRCYDQSRDLIVSTGF
jgi:hypothetical protein